MQLHKLVLNSNESGLYRRLTSCAHLITAECNMDVGELKSGAVSLYLGHIADFQLLEVTRHLAFLYVAIHRGLYSKAEADIGHHLASHTRLPHALAGWRIRT